MSVQNNLDNNNTPFILLANPGASDAAATLLQDAGRGAVALVQFTLLAKISATGKYVPYTDIAAVDGSGLPAGIYLGDDIAGADIVAGDVVDLPVLVGGNAFFDENQLILENSLTLATVIGGVTLHNQTIRDALKKIGLYSEDTVDISSFQA